MQSNLGLFLTKRSLLNADAEALVEIERQRRFTFAELNERCNRIANVLRDKGIGKDDRVALLMMNGVEYVESFFACAKVGAVIVPLNWRLVPDELEFILKDSGSVALIFDSEFDESAQALQGRDVDVSNWIRVGDDASRADWAESYDAATAAASADEPTVEAGGSDRLFIINLPNNLGIGGKSKSLER